MDVRLLSLLSLVEADVNKFGENLTEREYSSDGLTRYQCLTLLDHKLVFCTLVILTLKYPQS